MMVALVTEKDIVDGLQSIGLDHTSNVLVHASLRSFGCVEGHALSVCKALVSVCGTVMMSAGSWDLTGLPVLPPGLVRPFNACRTAESWEAFDAAVTRATPFRDDLPIDRELGIIPETMRMQFGPSRSAHPLMSFIALGNCANALLGTQRLDWPLGPIEALAELDGVCSCLA
jgi:aminoglycoside 3-N-acetyltransferase